MRSNSPNLLRGALKVRAEAFFGVDLSSVTVRIDEEPRTLGAAAFARGDAVHLSPSAASLPPPLFDEVLGHELAHVVQQREGRVPSRRSAGGVEINDDGALEAEAADLGRRFAYRPRDRPRPARPARRPGPAVAQRIVTAANRMIPRSRSLAERTRLVLGFIEDGPAWLDWAAGTLTVKYDFSDETRLLEGIQTGLHASPFLLLRRLGLLVSPVKLMTLKPVDLQTLAAGERGDTSSIVDVQTRKILTEQRLLTQADLAAGDRFLVDVGVAGTPLFHAMGLAERIAIHDVVRISEGQLAMRADLQRECATFGVEHAQTPAEFVDFYKSYLLHAAKLGLLDEPPEQRAAAARAAVKALGPCLYRSLDCPQIGGLAAPAEVARVVSNWITSGRRIGFAWLSSGIRQIIHYTPFTQQTGDAARSLVEGYLKEAQAFLAANEPAGGRLGQDGASCTLPIESDTMQGELDLGGGQITLRSFRLKSTEVEPAQAPAPATLHEHQESAT